MRTNLRCPFQDKDHAKQLGARWDPKLRLWYVENLPDLTPFARWLPGGQAGAGAVDAAAARPAVHPSSPALARSLDRPGQAGAVVTGPDVVPDCGCTALPWEPCACVKQLDSGA